MEEYKLMLKKTFEVMYKRARPFLKLMYKINKPREDFELFLEDFFPILKQIHERFAEMNNHKSPINANQKIWSQFLLIVLKKPKDFPKGFALACMIIFAEAKKFFARLKVTHPMRIKICASDPGYLGYHFQCGLEIPDLKHKKSRIILYAFLGSREMFGPFKMSITYNNKNLKKAALEISKIFHRPDVEFVKFHV